MYIYICKKLYTLGISELSVSSPNKCFFIWIGVVIIIIIIPTVIITVDVMCISKILLVHEGIIP